MEKVLNISVVAVLFGMLVFFFNSERVESMPANYDTGRLSKMRCWLIKLFENRPAFVLLLPIIIFQLYWDFISAMHADTIFAGRVFLYYAVPTLILYFAKKFNQKNVGMVLAIIAIWIPFSWHWIGKKFPAGGGMHSDWPLLSATVVPLTIILFRHFCNLEGMKLNAKIRTEELFYALLAVAWLAIALIPIGTSIGFLHLKSIFAEAHGLERVGLIFQVLCSWTMLKTLALTAIAVALGEELFFRAIIQNLLQKALKNKLMPILIASLLFGLGHAHKHATSYDLAHLNWGYVFMASIAGFIYGIMYRRTRSLLLPILVHASVDSIWHLLFV